MARRLIAKQAKYKEAQFISEAVLDAEVKIGELMRALPKAQGKRIDEELRDTAVPKSKIEAIEEAGFTKKQAQRFEQLASNPELVERAKAEARANDDIVLMKDSASSLWDGKSGNKERFNFSA